MGASPVTNVLVLKHNSGSPLTSSVGLHPCRWFNKTFGLGLHTWWWFNKIQCFSFHTCGWFSGDFFWIFMHLNSGSPITLSGDLNTFWYLGSRQCLCLHTWWFTKNKEMAYTPMGGLPIINVLVYTKFVGSPKNNVETLVLVGTWIVKDLKKIGTNILLYCKRYMKKIRKLVSVIFTYVRCTLAQYK